MKHKLFILAFIHFLLSTIFVDQHFANTSKFQNKISTCYSFDSSDFKCRSSITIKISSRDTVYLVASMFLVDESMLDQDFIVKLRDSNHDEYSYITAETESPILYKITEISTGKYCIGRIDIIKEVSRNCNSHKLHFPTVKNIIVLCNESTEPLDIGLPIPLDAEYIGRSSEYIFLFDNWDSCGLVELTYEDLVIEGSCALGYDRIIEREWTVTNSEGMQTSTKEKITIEFSTINDFESIPNYDGIDQPKLVCDYTWPRLNSGAPDPSFTGHYNANNFVCNNLEFIYEDDIILHPNCETPNIVYRTWSIYDWCASQKEDRLQVIKIDNCFPDTISPMIKCKNDIDVKLKINNKASLDIEDLHNRIIDNCKIKTISLNRKRMIDRITFSSKDVNMNFPVTIYVTDQAGNIDSCTTIVHVLPRRGIGK